MALNTESIKYVIYLFKIFFFLHSRRVKKKNMMKWMQNLFVKKKKPMKNIIRKTKKKKKENLLSITNSTAFSGPFLWLVKTTRYYKITSRDEIYSPQFVRRRRDKKKIVKFYFSIALA